MLEFCTCGSLIIDEQCTNKNCSYKTHSASTQTKTKTSRKTSTAKKAPKASKTTRTKKASKVVTYNIYETEEEKEM